MKKALLGMAMAAFLVSLPLALPAQTETPAEGYYAASYARVNYVNGDVWVQRTADLGYEKVDVNLALIQGDKLGTGEGQAEIHFGRRNYLRLARNTKVEFALLPKDGDDRIKIHVLEGSAYLRVSALPVEKGVEVHTPDASFYVMEEGLYRFDIRADQRTVASAHEGSLEAAAEEGSVVVGNGESVEASNGRLLGQPAYLNAARDEFDQWSDSRDNLLLAQKSTNRYLPSEIDEYQDELDQNGHWVYEQPYGNVWVPSGVDDDWRPYMYGRWVWYPLIGWNWVSSEPWGWSVYHYGRWHWRFGLGWYWIPTHYWGPAWVHWWNDYDYIGWCPLSWYNRPAVLWNGRFYDRFYDRDFPIHNRAMSVIHRNQLQEHGLNRHVLRSAELGRVASRVSLRAEQPSIRPALVKSGPRADEARRVLGSGSLRGGERGISARPSATGGILRRGGEGTSARGAEPRLSSNPSRGAVNGGTLRSPSTERSSSGERSIRSYPGNGSSSRGSAASGSQDRPSAVIRSPRAEGAGSRENPSRTVSPRTGGSGSNSSRPQSVNKGQDKSQDKGQAQSRGKESSGGTVKSGEKIKNYPGSMASTSAWSPRSSSSSVRSSDRSSNSVRTYGSRLSPSQASGSSARTPSYSTPRSSVSRYSAPSSSRGSSSNQPRTYSSPSRSSVTRSSSRSSSPAYSSPRSSTPRYSSPSPSRSSFSSPSRSSGSSSRSFSAPRSSGSSGRSYSSPRSSGSSSSSRSSSSRSSSSSSSRSSSSSSRSSSSSGRSSSSRHKG
jgi:hypothetical protein